MQSGVLAQWKQVSKEETIFLCNTGSPQQITPIAALLRKDPPSPDPGLTISFFKKESFKPILKSREAACSPNRHWELTSFFLYCFSWYHKCRSNCDATTENTHFLLRYWIVTLGKWVLTNKRTVDDSNVNSFNHLTFCLLGFCCWLW